jgi:hypothetical protein
MVLAVGTHDGRVCFAQVKHQQQQDDIKSSDLCPDTNNTIIKNPGLALIRHTKISGDPVGNALCSLQPPGNEVHSMAISSKQL